MKRSLFAQGKEVLGRSFFKTDPIIAAHDLLGWRLCFQGCEGLIVETEAYSALNDEACHTFFRPSARRFAEEYPAGTAYVYLNYGLHWLFNILVKGATLEECGFVLIRAVIPMQGIEEMQQRRRKGLLKKHPFVQEQLCNGPGKMTSAFGINGTHHGLDLFQTEGWSFQRDSKRAKNIQATPRIGISRAQERLWRFVAKGTKQENFLRVALIIVVSAFAFLKKKFKVIPH